MVVEPRDPLQRRQLDRLARLESVRFDPAPAGASAQLVVEGETITVPLEGVIDIAAERDRLTKALAAAAKERDGLEKLLGSKAKLKKLVREEIVAQFAFCDLLHFAKEPAKRKRAEPKLLIVAPMSGHYATLLRGTVADTQARPRV